MAAPDPYATQVLPRVSQAEAERVQQEEEYEEDSEEEGSIFKSKKFIAGLVMDYVQDKYLFLYSAACIVIAIVLMAFVKHGDSIVLAKGRKLTKEEKRQIRLDSMDSAD